MVETGRLPSIRRMDGRMDGKKDGSEKVGEPGKKRRESTQVTAAYKERKMTTRCIGRRLPVLGRTKYEGRWFWSVAATRMWMCGWICG